MKYVFFGSPRFAEVVLEKLIAAGLPPALVVCNPDRPVGRKKILTPPPAKVLAAKHGLPFWQPEKLEGWADHFAGAEFAVLAAYAKILPEELIKHFPRGIIGVHPSLLPKYRGATPIQSAILAGEQETGTALFLLDAKVDHGPVLALRPLAIAETDNYLTLMEKLAVLSGELLTEVLPQYLSKTLTASPQNDALASYTKKFAAEDGYADLEKDPPSLIKNKIRALNPEPGVYTIRSGKRYKILDGRTIQPEGGVPREVPDAITFLRSL